MSVTLAASRETFWNLNVVVASDPGRLDVPADVYLVHGCDLRTSPALRQRLAAANPSTPVLFCLGPEDLTRYGEVITPHQDFLVQPFERVELEIRLARLACRAAGRTTGAAAAPPHPGSDIAAPAPDAAPPARAERRTTEMARFRGAVEEALVRARRHGGSFAICALRYDPPVAPADAVARHARLVAALVQERATQCVRHTDVLSAPTLRSLSCGPASGRMLLLLDHVRSAGDAADTVARLIESLSASMIIDGEDVYLNPRAGIALFPGDGEAPSEMVAAAEEALAFCGRHGRQAFQLFSPTLQADFEQRQRLESRLRTAVAESAFTLAFQPRIQLATGTTAGFEALLRWNDAELGSVSPGQFIPVAEELGLIHDITRWLVPAACRQASAWAAQGHRFRLSINLSAADFEHDDLVPLIQRALTEHTLAPRFLEVEVTETTLIGDLKRTQSVLGHLRRLGVSVALDDFGTGYSSLNHLRQIPIDTLKLDRTFIQDLGSNWYCGAVTSGIITLAQTLGVAVVAEGVELDRQLEFLREHDCDEIQGAWFSMPLPPEAAARWLPPRPQL